MRLAWDWCWVLTESSRCQREWTRSAWEMPRLVNLERIGECRPPRWQYHLVIKIMIYFASGPQVIVPFPFFLAHFLSSDRQESVFL